MNESVDENELQRIAESSTNPLFDAQIPTTLETPRGIQYTLTYSPLSDLNIETRKAMLLELEANLRPLYEIEWGWDINERRKELFAAKSKYIFVTNTQTGEPAAWIMFKFDWDDLDEPEHPVLYLYEIHVRESERSSGIGVQLLRVLTTVGDHFGMWKTMLTCFKANERAMQFYLRNGFGIDSNSPSMHGSDDQCYEILSNRPKLR